MGRLKWNLVLAGVFGSAWLLGSAAPAQAQQQGNTVYGPFTSGYTLNPFWYYPYYYFPHNFWPIMGPRYPEPPGTPYRPPPAYMAFPPFKEVRWRYEYWEPQPYHRGNHFLLDIF